ncbi:MAG: hypothetical protein M3Q14_03190 [bacterium]|nr:hypothetical protein [bacterium]
MPEISLYPDALLAEATDSEKYAADILACYPELVGDVADVFDTHTDDCDRITNMFQLVQLANLRLENAEMSLTADTVSPWLPLAKPIEIDDFKFHPENRKTNLAGALGIAGAGLMIYFVNTKGINLNNLGSPFRSLGYVFKDLLN